MFISHIKIYPERYPNFQRFMSTKERPDILQDPSTLKIVLIPQK